MSVICETFGCTPSEAMSQDYTLTMAVLDYRSAAAARDAFQSKDRKQGFDVLAANPSLPRILSRMTRAQLGAALDIAEDKARAEGLDVALANRTTEDEEAK